MGKPECWRLQWLNGVKEKPDQPWKADRASDPEALQTVRSGNSQP